MKWLASIFSITDEQAMWRVQTDNDHHAFALLVDRYQAKMKSLSFRMTGDLQTSEDLVQEMFKRLFEKRKDYNPAKSFAPYLWRIGVNICYDELRRRGRKAETCVEDTSELFIDFGGTETGPDHAASINEEAAIVKHALLQLPEIYRVVLILRHYEGLKRREIAEVLDIPEGTVNSRMAEGLERMTQLLSGLLQVNKKSPREEALIL